MASRASSEAPAWLLRQHPCCPVRRFVSLSSASRPSPAVSAHKAISPVSFRVDRTSRLHLPAPLRSPGITRLHRYYGCSDSCAEARPRGLLAEGGTWNPFSSCAAQVSSLHVFHPSRAFRLQPPSCPPMIALTPTFSASWASCSHRSGLRLSLAGSPVSMAESSLLSLRTTPFAFHCSPPRLAATQLRSATGRCRLT